MNHYLRVIEDNFEEALVVQSQILIGITEIEEWVALGGTGVVSVGAVEFNRYAENRIKNNIYPFRHEGGHSLGLGHTENTYQCLNRLGLPIQNPDSPTFVSTYPDIDTVNVRISPEEASLLLEPEYASERDESGNLVHPCLILLGYRPHPSEYLRITKCKNKMDFNGDNIIGIDDLAVILVNWGDCFPTRLIEIEGSNELRCRGDLDCNTQVDVDDLAKVLVNWG